MSVTGRIVLTLCGLSLCTCLGCCTGLIAHLNNVLPLEKERPPHIYPYPHHIPKQPDGISLRFAMVHDVVHERFPRHGTAYYLERNRRVRQNLADLKQRGDADGRPSEQYFALLDDLAVGLEFVGEHNEAIRVLRDKLEQQKALGLTGRQLYSTYANLGTFLILGPFRQVRPGNEADKQVLREGLALIQQSIDVNPDAHFGREIWQAVLIEYMIALHGNPDMLANYDMIGNSLDKEIDPSKRRCLTKPEDYGHGFHLTAENFLAATSPTPNSRKDLRNLITRVGAEGSVSLVLPSLSAPVPFDEPTLGIIGMWRLGGGAHPYFALALAETMLRVGQEYIAWSAYERAARLAPLAWPERPQQELFEAHCRKREAAIEGQLPSATVARLRPAFEADLARGQEYQRAYQRYEEEQIHAGRPLDDPHFFDTFDAEHGSIASRVGPEDQFAAYRMEYDLPPNTIPAIVLFAGLGTLLGSGILWTLSWCRRRWTKRSEASVPLVQ
jgi:hypothetical protein